MGVLKWVDWTVSEPRYFQLQTDHTPVHLALLDEVGGCRARDGTLYCTLLGPCCRDIWSLNARSCSVRGWLLSILKEGFPFKELVSLAPKISSFQHVF